MSQYPASPIPPDREYSAHTNLLIHALRYRIAQDPDGNYRFSRVRVVDPKLPRHRVEFLITLMEGRTLVEIIATLSPQMSTDGPIPKDSVTAVDLRDYFSTLETLLQASPHAKNLPAI